MRVDDSLRNRLVQTALPGRFTEHELDGLPEPARRHLSAVITPGAALARVAEIRMRGRIKVGRWLPFRARQTINPHRGFIWAARAGGLITGWDRYVDAHGAMQWKAAGLFPVSGGSGPDVTLSAAGRLAAESIWVPTALLPRCEVRWTSDAPDAATLHYDLDGHSMQVTYRLDDQGRIVTLYFDRWGDPDGTGSWGWHSFGSEISNYQRFGDVLVPQAGRVGWHFGNERRPDGAFFEFEILQLRPLTE